MNTFRKLAATATVASLAQANGEKLTIENHDGTVINFEQTVTSDSIWKINASLSSKNLDLGETERVLVMVLLSPDINIADWGKIMKEH